MVDQAGVHAHPLPWRVGIQPAATHPLVDRELPSSLRGDSGPSSPRSPSYIAPHCLPMDDIKRPSLPEIMRPSGDPEPPPETSGTQNFRRPSDSGGCRARAWITCIEEKLAQGAAGTLLFSIRWFLR